MSAAHAEQEIWVWSDGKRSLEKRKISVMCHWLLGLNTTLDIRVKDISSGADFGTGICSHSIE